MTVVARTCQKCKKIHKIEEPEFEACFNGGGDAAPSIVMDVEPHYSPATGGIVTSRREIREGVRKNNLIEVGNEKPSFMK